MAMKANLRASAMSYFALLTSIVLISAIGQAKTAPASKPKRDIAAAQPAFDPTLKAVREFYTAYLDLDHNKVVPAAQTAAGMKFFSKIFRDLVALNADLCSRKTPDEVCGWSADGDPFLSAQELGAGLKAANSELLVTEVPSTVAGHRLIAVTFNIDPLSKEPGAASRRELRFSMGLQNGKWAADDLIAIEKEGNGPGKEHSSVASMRREIDGLFSL
jgi:hypothetical protein